MTETGVVAAGPEAGALAGLRVLVFCDYFSERSCGGAEKVTREIVGRLTGLGATLRVVSAIAGGEVGTHVGLHVGRADPIDLVRVRAFDLTRLCGAQLAVTYRLGSVARGNVESFRPTVLYAHSIHFQGTVAAARLASRLGIPLVTTVHVAAIDALGGLTQWATRAYEGSMGRFILSRSREVIAVSDAVADHVRSLAPPATPVTVVPNGVDHSRFFPRADTGDAAQARAVPVVLFVGRLVGNKGPGLFIDALRLLQARGIEVAAHFAGDGPLLPELRRRAQGLRHVRFLGRCEDIEVRMREADALVRPSFTEGMPLAVLEAMASGLCVVASDVPGNAGLIRHGANGLLFRSGDAADLADALALVVADPGRRAALAAAARQDALQHSWDRAAEATGEVLMRAAAASGRIGS